MSTSSQSIGSSGIQMLKDDHNTRKRLIENYQEAHSSHRSEIAQTIMHELEIHAALEERLIYPAIREHIDADELMNEAIEEHHVMHVLLTELKKLRAQDERFKAKLKVLGKFVKAYIEEEGGEAV